MKQHFLSVAIVAGLGFAGAAFAADPMSKDGAGAASTAPAQTKADLIGDKVVDLKGIPVGTVKDIKTDAQGSATAVVVSVGTRDVAVPATAFQVASNDTLMTTKSAKELSKMPAEPKSGSAGSTSPDAGGSSVPQ